MLKSGVRRRAPGYTVTIPLAAVAFVTISNANGYMVSIPQVLLVTIPACLIGLLCASVASYKRGKDLDKDPDFLLRKSDPEMYQYMYGNTATTLDKEISKEAKASVFIFLGALLGIGRAEGFSDAMTAGAIISGAYFGDKISPLSDTTVLAASVNRVRLFEHIHYMYFTTVPSFLITLAVFTILGFTHGGAAEIPGEVYSGTLAARFHITPWLMIVPAITVFLIWKNLPAIMVLAISTLTAAAAAVIFQPEVVRLVGEVVT